MTVAKNKKSLLNLYFSHHYLHKPLCPKGKNVKKSLYTTLQNWTFNFEMEDWTV